MFPTNYQFQIIDILKEYDRSNEPVTHFPSQIVPQSPIQELTEGANANMVKIAHEVQDDGDDDSWNDSYLSSDEEHVTNNRLVKSKVRTYLMC